MWLEVKANYSDFVSAGTGCEGPPWCGSPGVTTQGSPLRSGHHHHYTVLPTENMARGQPESFQNVGEKVYMLKPAGPIINRWKLPSGFKPDLQLSKRLS